MYRSSYLFLKKAITLVIFGGGGGGGGSGALDPPPLYGFRNQEIDTPKYTVVQ